MGPHDFDAPTKKLFAGIWSQMAKCMYYVSKILDGRATPYSNAVNAFEVFGCDFMVTEDHKVKLLEVNERTGLSMSDFPERRDEFTRIYFGHIRDLVLIPFFTPQRKHILEYDLEPIYSSTHAK